MLKIFGLPRLMLPVGRVWFSLCVPIVGILQSLSSNAFPTGLTHHISKGVTSDTSCRRYECMGTLYHKLVAFIPPAKDEWDFCQRVLKILATKKASKDTLLKNIPEPTRLEFLTSIALKKIYRDLEVLPNYSVDDEGLPTSHASGGKPDIICDDSSSHAITEVSLLCGRAQLSNELIPIARHLDEESKQHKDKHNFALFIAPTIHGDCQRYARFAKQDENLEICNLDINSFIKKLKNTTHIAELLYV